MYLHTFFFIKKWSLKNVILKWRYIVVFKGLLDKKHFTDSSKILSSQSIKLKCVSSVQLLLLFEISLKSVRNCCPLMYSCSLATKNFSRNFFNSFSWLFKTAISENKSNIRLKKKHFLLIKCYFYLYEVTCSNYICHMTRFACTVYSR